MMEQNDGLDQEIAIIQKQFLAGVSPKHIFNRFSEEDWKWKDELWQQHLVDSTLENPLIIKYPLLTDYKRTFLKHVMTKLEKNTVEITEKLFELYADLIQESCKSGVDEYSCRIYFLTDSLIVILKESQSFISHGTTGLVTWQASKALAEWCINNSNVFRKRSVLELGCGLGLTGTVVCKSCDVTSYVFTDSDSEVLRMLRCNLGINFPKNEADCESNVSGNSETCSDEYSWNATSIFVTPFHWDDDDAMKSIYKLHAPSIILAADVIYDTRSIPFLVKVLKYFLQNDELSNQTVAYVSCTVRNEDTLVTFLKVAECNGLQCEELHCPLKLFFYDECAAVKILKICILNTSL